MGPSLSKRGRSFPKFFPLDGWVEHDPEAIWDTVLDVTRAMVKHAKALGTKPLAIGITNQRETAIIWDRNTGEPIYNAIVWQDRRTANVCQTIRNEGHEPTIAKKTGLLVDPYFTASKFSWILDKVDGARDRAHQANFVLAQWIVF